MKLISAFYLTCIFLCATPIISQACLEGISEGNNWSEQDLIRSGCSYRELQMMLFADSLFASGNYFAAAIAYERLFYHAANPDIRFRANLSKVQALKQQGAYAKAFADIQRSLLQHVEPAKRAEVLYEMAFCAYMDGQYREALNAIVQWEHSFQDQAVEHPVRLVKGLTLLRLGQWQALEEHIWRMASLYESDSVQMLSKKISGHLHRVPRIKKPERAGLLSSFIPGAGQFYAEAPGKGVLNASSQILSLGTALLLANSGHYIATFSVGLGLFQGFYFGGVRQAARLAVNRNEGAMNEFIQNLGEQLMQLDAMIVRMDKKRAKIAPEKMIENVLMALYRFDFLQADALQTEMETLHPGHYLTELARTNLYWWRIISDPDPGALELPYRESVSRALSMARKQTNPADSDSDLFHLIAIYAFQARLDLKNRAYVSAMRNSRNALTYIEMSKDRTSGYGGFLITAGLYNYMTVKAARQYPFLRIYGLFYPEGNRELGLAQLRMASRSDNLVWRTEANYFLMRIFYDMEEEPARALESAAWLTSEYPSNLIFQYYHLLALLGTTNNADQIATKRQEIQQMAKNNASLSESQKEYFILLSHQAGR